MRRELGTAEIAEMHEISQRQAQRWLRSIQKVYGDAVVSRRGKKYITNADAFARVAPLIAKKAVEERRVRELEERVTDAEKRIDRQERELAEFRRRSAAWFSRTT